MIQSGFLWEQVSSTEFGVYYCNRKLISSRREADAGECFNAHGGSCQINVLDVTKTDNL